MQRRRWVFLFLVVTLGWVRPARAADDPAGPPPASTAAGTLSLPVPASAAERDYLGLSGEGTFQLPQVRARIVLVEVFSFYCPHCQRAAPLVNALFRRIEERADARGVIKLIGLGAGNSLYEVRQFREKYGVPFPLFPDGDFDLTRKLDVRVTPTFAAFRPSADGGLRRVYFREGGFSDADQVLTELLQDDNPTQEKKP